MTPLFKSGTKEDINNYQPISILPVLSKILEKYIHDSLMEFLNCFNLLYATQSGFRPGHSCETALVGMINRWLRAVNEDSMAGVVMADFKKAFDLVDHNLLLKKLKHYRLSDVLKKLKHYRLSDETLNWFSSYLLGKKQKVSIGNFLSEDENIINGVPQGSILGPLLFLLFVNDLHLYTDKVALNLYADDTTLYTTAKSIQEIKNNLQQSLISLHK